MVPGPPGLALTLTERDGSADLYLAGVVDVATVAWLERALTSLAGRHVHVTVDLRDVTFLDSLGLALFVGVWAGLRARHGSLVLRNAGPPAQRMIELCGLHDLTEPADDPGESSSARDPGATGPRGRPWMM